MGAPHRRTFRNRLGRSAAALAVTVATVGGSLALAAAPAHAATIWFVAPPSAGGSTASGCGTAALPCTTVTLVIGKATFVNGETINVAAGTYADRPVFGAKGANILGAGTASTIFTGSNVSFAMGWLSPAGVTTTLSNLTLTAGKTNTGGALALGTGNVVTNNVDITNSTSPLGGGAYVAQGTTLTMNGGTVSGNTSVASTTALTGAGAGIYVVGKVGATAAGKLNLNGTNFTNNVATGGTAVAGGNGGAILNAGTAVIVGGTYTKNQVVASSNANPRKGQGGAILNGPQDTDDAPSLTISGVTITGGLASGVFNASSGGAIANAEGFGGPNSVLTASDVTLTGNTAAVGGGLYNAGTATLTGGSLGSNIAILGGGAYQSPLVTVASAATLVVDGTSFTSNLAINGGGILNSRTLTVKGNAVFTGNTAVSNGGAQPNGWGGAIYNGPSLPGDKPSATITDATFNGGAVSGGNAVIGGAIANAGTTALATVASGALPGRLEVLRGTFSKNVAAAAGAVYTGGATTITDSTLDQNQATSGSGGYGGALYSTPFPATDPANTVTVDNTDFTGNTTAFVGGAAAILKGSTASFTNGSTMTGGSAISGGGIYNAGATTVASSSVTGNNASFQGGGVYDASIVATDTPTLTLTNATVDGNTAASSGGGLIVGNLASVTGTGGTISGNSAVGAGGAFIADKGTASFDSTDFTGNTATGSAGGAFLNSGALTIKHALVSTNHAPAAGDDTGLGGAIYSGSNTANAATSLVIDASTLSFNDAAAGSVLVTFSPGSGATNLTSIDRSTITGNVSTTNIGAIEQFHPLSITNSTVTANTAAGGPGVLVMFVPASVRVAGSIFANNGTGACSAALAAANDGGYNLANPGDATCGFTPAKNDVSAQPLLGPLANNGGDTPTLLPGPTSPALDRIPTGTATGITDAVSGAAVVLCAPGAKDQRDIARPQGARCDIGSVEAAQVAPVVTGPNPVDLAVGVGAGTPGPTFTTAAATTPQATLTATGTLPTGITFVDNGNGTGSIHGTPAAGTGGNYPITVNATNEAGTGTFATVIVVHQAPKIQGPASDTYTVGVAGGPDHFSMQSGHPAATLSTSSTLPNGVTFTAGPGGTADIAGTPAVGTGGVYTIIIDATNGTPPDDHFTFTLTVKEGPTIAGPSSDTFTVGTAHTTAQFTTTGQPTPILTSTPLPSGLSLDTAVPGKATITGTPANGTGGEYDVTVTASNGVGTNATKLIHLVILEAPEITGPATVRFVAGTLSTAGYSADGYSPTNMKADLSKTGGLPAGITFVDNGNGTATLGGTAAIGTDGIYPITITATNGISPDDTLDVVLEIVPPVTITTTTLPGGSVGTPYGATVAATGGQPAYSFAKISGTLPPGLSLASNGTISGTPNGPVGHYTFTVQVTDMSDPQQTDTQQLSIDIGKGDTSLLVSPLLIEIKPGLAGIKVYVGYAQATLRVAATGTPIPGQLVTIRVGTTPGGGAIACTGVTDSNGVATCGFSTSTTLAAILAGGINGVYGGNAVWNPSSGSGGLLGL